MNVTRLSALALSLLLLCSCAPQPVPPESTPPVEQPPMDEISPSPQVQVDWSKLQQSKGDAAHPDCDGGRWYSETTTDLIPRDDYGPLYSYVGASVQTTQRWTDQNGEEHTWTSSSGTPVYGLMTRDGKIVTDPVYQGVYQPTYRRGTQVTALPVLLLSRADESWNYYDTNGQRYAVAASDGSWCTDFEFWVYGLKETSLLLVGPVGVTQICSDTGTRQDWSWDCLGIPEEAIYDMLCELMWLYGLQWTEQGAFLGLTEEDPQTSSVRLFHPEDGSITLVSLQEWEDILNESHQYNWNTLDNWEFTQNPDQITLTRGEERFILPIPDGLDTLHAAEVRDGLVILNDYGRSEGCTWLCDLSSGAVLAQANYIGFIEDRHDSDAPAFVHTLHDNGSQALYGPNFVPFLSYPAPHPSVQAFFVYQDGLIFARDDTTFFGCYDALSGNCIFYRNLGMGD